MFNSIQKTYLFNVVIISLLLVVFSNRLNAQNSIFPLVDDATDLGGGCYQLTPASPYQTGAVWFDPMVDLTQPFDIRVTMNFDNLFSWDSSDPSYVYPEVGGGADGIAFVMQQVDTAAGTTGGGIGYEGLTPSLAVEFDPYYNFNTDPIYDHIAISKNGDVTHTGAPYDPANYWVGTVLPTATIVPALGTDPVADRIHTGIDYDVRFKWDPVTTSLDVWFNCEHKFTFTEDIVNTIFGGDPNVIYGFTSSTGSEFSSHKVCMINNTIQADIPDTTICVGQSVQLDATIPNASPPVNYYWSPAAGLSDSSIANPVASPTTTTIYTLVITQGCYSDSILDTLTITVNPISPINIDPFGPFCLNSPNDTLTSSFFGGQWSGPGVIDVSEGIFSPSIAGLGNHKILYSFSGTCGASDSISVVVNSGATADAGLDATICEGNTYLIVGASIGGAAINQYWNTSGDGIFDDSTLISPVYNPGSTDKLSGIVTLTLTPTEPIGICPAITDDMVLTINSLADATISPENPTYCENDPVVLFTSITTGGIWSGAGVDVAGNFDPSVPGVGAHNIIYTISGVCGDVDTTIATINALPTVDAGLDAAICEGSTYTLSGANVGGGATSQYWNTLGDGVFNDSMLINPVYTPGSADILTGLVTLTITTDDPVGPCSFVTDDLILIINRISLVDAGYDTTICEGSSYNLIAANVGGLLSGQTWSTSGDGMFSNTGIVNPTYTPGVADILAGSAILTLTSNAAVGICSLAIDSMLLTIDTIPDVTIIPANPVFCENEAGLIFNTATGGGVWSGQGVSSQGEFSPSSVGSGTYNITYTINGGCGNSDNTVVTVNSVPSPVFNANVLTGCAPLTVTFTDQTVSSGVSCVWGFGDGTTSSDCNQVTHTYTGSGCFDVSLTISTGNGCTGTSVITNMICVSNTPIANFSFTPSQIKVPITLASFTNLSIGANAYSWSFDSLGTSSLEDPDFEFPTTQEGFYNVCLTATNSTGCKDEICKVLQVKDDYTIYVPNTFTPNGDGKNKVFKPIVSGAQIENYKLMIFNRWGELLFEGGGLSSSWDGNYKGVMSMEGVYVWKIVLKGEKINGKKEFYGHVNLLR